MADIQAQIKQAKEQLERATKDLAMWESFESVTATDESGKTFNVRSEMTARCKWNMQRYRAIIAALEKRTEKPN
jgi:phage-related protein